jgi:hypothetical protein
MRAGRGAKIFCACAAAVVGEYARARESASAHPVVVRRAAIGT